MFMVMSEYYQQLAPLLLEPINRTHRLYLENHPELLSVEHQQFLAQLIKKYNDHSSERQELYLRLELLRDIRERVQKGCGHDAKEVIRDVYVNRFGGLILDIPTKLAGIEHYLEVPSYAGWTERMIVENKICLRHTIIYAQVECASSPELIAEMNYCLGRLFVQTSPIVSQHIQKRILSYYEDAHNTYTYERYPLQYAKVLEAIGEAYMWYPLVDKQENARIALKFYERASEIRNKYNGLP